MTRDKRGSTGSLVGAPALLADTAKGLRLEVRGAVR